MVVKAQDIERLKRLWNDWIQTGWDDDGNTLDEFEDFPEGTSSTEVHQWFEDEFPGFRIAEAWNDGIEKAIKRVR